MKTMKIVSKRNAIAANPNQSGKSKQLRIERTEHIRILIEMGAGKWFPQIWGHPVPIGYIWVAWGVGFLGFADRLDDGDLMMMKKFENDHSKTAEKTTKKKPYSQIFVSLLYQWHDHVTQICPIKTIKKSI